MAKLELNLERLLKPIAPVEGKGVSPADYSPEGAGRYYGYEYGPIQDARRTIEAPVLHGDDDDASRTAYALKPQAADWNKVVKLGIEVIARESKDLQVCAWVVEALGQLRGLDGLREGFDFMRALQEAYWTTGYPRIENGDTYDRQFPYESLTADDSVPMIVRSLPLTSDASGSRYSYFKRLEALESQQLARRAFDSEHDRDAWIEARMNKYRKIFPKQWEDAVRFTDTSYYETMAEQLASCLLAFKRWERSTDRLFDGSAPDLAPIETAIHDCANVVVSILNERGNPQGEILADTLERARRGELDPPIPETDDEPIDEDSIDEGPEPATDDDGSEEPALAEADEDDVTDTGGAVNWGREPSPASSSNGARRRAVAAVKPSTPATGPPSSMEEARQRILDAAAWMRSQAPDDPTAYLVARTLRAGELTQGDDLIGPSRELRTALADLAESERWSELIPLAEEAIGSPVGRGWLDLHRIAIQALESEGHETAASACRQFLGLLLEQIPDLPERELDDRTPTASAQTLRWLEENIRRHRSTEAAIADDSDDSESDQDTESASEDRRSEPDHGEEPSSSDRATELLDSGDVAGAITWLNREIARAPTERERFVRKLRLAEVCVEHWLTTLALPLLDDLVGAIDQHRLTLWEGTDFCARAVRARFTCLDRTKGREPDDQLIAAYEQLVRFDPAAALAYKWDETS